MPTEKKDYHRSLTHRELELILEILKPLSLRLTPENQRILGRATTKLQKLFDEQNPRNKEKQPTEHGSLKSFCIYTLPEIYFIKKVKSMV
jgi:hypothetical protein